MNFVGDRMSSEHRIGAGIFLFFAVLSSSPPAAFAAVDSRDGSAKAIQELKPGAIVEVADGMYTTTKPIGIYAKRGTAESPIILRAEHHGRAVIGGAAGFVVRDCEYLLLEGFVFTHD